MKSKRKEVIKAGIAIGIVIIIVAIAIILTIKYHVEGEQKMPFKLSKIMVVSTAEGVENENTAEKWNFKIYQNNDTYFSIERTQECKEDDKIKTIKIENIQIIEQPKIGQIKAFMPNSAEGRAFSYAEEYIIQGQNLEYKGAAKSDTRTLEIGNQGGTAVIRFSNTNLGEYASNEDTEIVHDGTLLQKINLKQEEMKFKVTFDFVITTRENSYKTNIKLSLPSGDIIQEGNSIIELQGDEFIFKRM